MTKRYPSHQPPSNKISERTPGEIAGHIVFAAVLLTFFLWLITIVIVSF